VTQSGYTDAQVQYKARRSDGMMWYWIYQKNQMVAEAYAYPEKRCPNHYHVFIADDGPDVCC
jgi:hypothetical protein